MALENGGGPPLPLTQEIDGVVRDGEKEICESCSSRVGGGGWTPGIGHGTEMEALALVQLLFSGGAARF